MFKYFKNLKLEKNFQDSRRKTVKALASKNTNQLEKQEKLWSLVEATPPKRGLDGVYKK